MFGHNSSYDFVNNHDLDLSDMKLNLYPSDTDQICPIFVNTPDPSDMKLKYNAFDISDQLTVIVTILL